MPLETQKPQPLTDQEKMDIFHFPRYEEDIKSWYRRLRYGGLAVDDRKIETVVDNVRTMIWLIDKLMESNNIIRCVRAERELKKKDETIVELKQALAIARAEKKGADLDA
jgi:hypothetical protein